MGLTYQSTKNDAMTDLFRIEKNTNQSIIALAGNPNTGKSTVFNSLTGMHQHTGNWPGKTVVNVRGEYHYKDTELILIDIPGTYSLFASSAEEEVARDFICFGNPDVIIVVADATCLERNLNLLLQIMELSTHVVLCINLMDEAAKKHISIDAKGLENELGIPVVLCAARSGDGIPELKEACYQVLKGDVEPSNFVLKYPEYIERKLEQVEEQIEDIHPGLNPKWMGLRLLDADSGFIDSLQHNIPVEKRLMIQNLCSPQDLITERKQMRDVISECLYQKAEELKDNYVITESGKKNRDRIIDDYITSRKFGIPLMLLTLSLILWITISGANVPSKIISDYLFRFGDFLSSLLLSAHAPTWLHELLISGIYKTLAWVISVMLPPMAIFFPLFTILEDLGYLPRIAFNLDHMFKKACAHGKQGLCMCMGFGCNAAGIISCRIIESPRERMIATLTNNFVPCNGRFPALIAISTVFLASYDKLGILPVLSVTLLILVGIVVTLTVSYGLSKTILKGMPSTFTLELPPYRIPKIGRLLYTSMIDRTLFVLWRAVVIAAPAGGLTWILGNVMIGDVSIVTYIATFLDPFAQLIGLDGFILMAFVLGLPANEIVLPILLMAYLSTGSMVDLDSLASLREILISHGWTPLTALNMMLFSLLHWPCATTLITIRKETGSLKWTALAVLIPTGIAVVVCFLTTTVYRLI